MRELTEIFSYGPAIEPIIWSSERASARVATDLNRNQNGRLKERQDLPEFPTQGEGGLPIC